MSPEPFDSCAKAPPAKKWEKGYGDENDFFTSQFCLAGANSLIIPGRGTARGKHFKLLAFGLMLIG